MKKRRPPNRYYRNAKFSEYTFKKLLHAFVDDVTPTQTAKTLSLSLNTINSVFVKIRMHGVALGLFYDFEAHETGSTELSVATRNQISAFHEARMAKRYGITNPSSAFMHRCESQWRFNYELVFNLGNAEAAHTQMYADLLELIKISGPVGEGVQNLDKASQAMLDQMERRLTWLERSSPDMKALDLQDFIKAEKIRLAMPLTDYSSLLKDLIALAQSQVDEEKE